MTSIEEEARAEAEKRFPLYVAPAWEEGATREDVMPSVDASWQDAETEMERRAFEAGYIAAASRQPSEAEELLVRAIQAHRALHPTYGSTSACGGGIGGQVLTEHCAQVCANPKHDEAKEAWEAVERDFFAARTARGEQHG